MFSNLMFSAADQQLWVKHMTLTQQQFPNDTEKGRRSNTCFPTDFNQQSLTACVFHVYLAPVKVKKKLKTVTS